MYLASNVQPTAIDDWHNYSADKFKETALTILYEWVSYDAFNGWLNCLIVPWLWLEDYTSFVKHKFAKHR